MKFPKHISGKITPEDYNFSYSKPQKYAPLLRSLSREITRTIESRGGKNIRFVHNIVDWRTMEVEVMFYSDGVKHLNLTISRPPRWFGKRKKVYGWFDIPILSHEDKFSEYKLTVLSAVSY